VASVIHSARPSADGAPLALIGCATAAGSIPGPAAQLPELAGSREQISLPDATPVAKLAASGL